METQEHSPSRRPPRPRPAMQVHLGHPQGRDEGREALAKRGTPDAMLRLGVRGGGCSGFAYVIEFADEKGPRDQVFEFDGVRVVVDPKSLVFLARHHPRLRDQADAARLQVREPQRVHRLRLRRELHRLSDAPFGRPRPVHERPLRHPRPAAALRPPGAPSSSSATATCPGCSTPTASSAPAPPAERRAALERAIAVNDAWRLLRDPLSRAESLLRASTASSCPTATAPRPRSSWR
jgi:iron-sulfur cluster assembly accessory protein